MSTYLSCTCGATQCRPGTRKGWSAGPGIHHSYTGSPCRIDDVVAELEPTVASVIVPTELRFSPDFSPIDGPSAFIQWKGTDVCLDFSCPCGASGHFDGYFAYQLRCHSCGQVFDMPHTVSLVPQQRFEHEVIVDVEPHYWATTDAPRLNGGP